MTIKDKIKHFESLGFNVLSFQQYKSILNQIGYDITIAYADKWGTVNSWDGVQYVATKCFYTNSNVAFCNVKGDKMKVEKDAYSLSQIRLNYCFYFGDKIYVV